MIKDLSKIERCNICNKKGLQSKKYLELLYCKDCDLFWKKEIESKTDLENKYAKFYSKKDSSRFDEKTERIINIYRYLRKKDVENFCKKGNLLDVGFGRPIDLEIFERSGWKASGTQISKTAYINAKKRKLDVYYGELTKLNIKKKFDLIIMSEVLEHIENEDKMLKKIHYLLKKDGKLILSVPFDQNLWSRSDELVNHKRRYTKKYLKMIIEKNGFKINDMVCYGFPLLRIYWLLKKNFMKDSSIKPIKPKKSMIKKIFFKTINKIFLLDLLLTNTNKGVGLITICSNNSVK